MVLGHNLEKNLRKIEGLRQKGQLQKALKQLQEWARKHSDTPHYLYEAAIVAFDLRDYGVGINSLKQLLRALPSTREKVLAACIDRYQEDAALPLAEFLVENQIANREYESALDTVAKLESNQVDVYDKKMQQRMRNLSPTGELDTDAARGCAWTLLAIADARKDGEAFSEHASALIASDAKLAQPIVTLCQRKMAEQSEPAWLHFAMGRAFCAMGSIGQGAGYLAKAATRLRQLAEPALSDLASMKPDEDEMGSYHYAIGRLSLVNNDGIRAAEELWKAADLVPEVREELINALASGPEPTDPKGLEAVVKLRLRLLVVESRYDDVDELVKRITQEGICDPAELKSLLGSRQTDESKPTELSAILVENALRSKDLRAAAQHLANISDHDGAALRRVLATLRSVIDEDPPEALLEWRALQAVLQSRTHDDAGANETLVELWEDEANDRHAVFAITQNTAERIVPDPALLTAILPHALETNQLSYAAEQLERMLDEREGFDEDLVGALTSFVERQKDAGSGVVELIDQLPKFGNYAQRLRYPTALAALYAGDYERAVPEFSVLLMGSPVERETILECFREAVREDPENARLHVAAYRVLKAEGEGEEAMRMLTRALHTDPSIVAELAKDLENELKTTKDDPTIWKAYANALFAARRFSQLDDACRRATEILDPSHSAHFRLLQAHMLVEEGKLSEGLTIVAAQMHTPDIDREVVREVLTAITQANPANSDAQVILGDNYSELGDVENALRAYDLAAQGDPQNIRGLLSKMRELAASPNAGAQHLVGIANFYRRAAQRNAAADVYERAMQLDESLAERILGDLEMDLRREDCEVSIRLLAARAARRAGDLERACRVLYKVQEQDDTQFEAILLEYRRLQEDFPEDLLPISYAARVLLQRDAAAAAAQILADSAGTDRYGLGERIEMLEEFHERKQNDPHIALLLAELYAEAGRVHPAVQLVARSLASEEVDLERAGAICKRLREEDANNTELGLVSFDVAFRGGRVDEALRVLPRPEYASLDQQSEITERMAPHARRVLADVELAPRYADALWRQGRREDALTALRTAAEKLSAREAEPLWTELAQRLYEAGDLRESRAVLEQLSREVGDRRRFYELFSAWNLKRLHSEGDALRVRVAENADDAELRLDYAENLLDQGLFDDVPKVLNAKFEDAGQRGRRAAILAQAHLSAGRSSIAEAVLQQATADVAVDSELAERHQMLLAECAGLLGKWAESHTRYSELIDSPRVGTKARARAERAYRHYLEDAAGDYRAVLYKVTELAVEREQDQEKP